MFVEVELNNLIDGEKYAILSTFNIDEYWTTIIERSEWGSPIWGYLKQYSGIENRNTYNKLLTIRNKENSPNFYAFIPQKEKIQQAMEQRALDKILKQLINDDFTW
jgi:hypothetical protein